MSAARRCPSARCASVGFTLVELLVVMVIIGMLALITATVAFTVIEMAKIAQISTEITNLEIALEDYKNSFGAYPPLLSDRDAVAAHVNRRWPENLDPDPFSSPEDAPAESLAFWLGSFSNDPEHPFTGTDKGAARFDFVEQQLKDMREAGGGLRFFKYYPPNLRKPYVYFESRSYDNLMFAKYEELTPYLRSDDDNIDPDDPADRFVNPQKIQIICAGLDNEYGRAGRFPDGPYDLAGSDNITNFAGKTLEDAVP